MNWPLAVYDRLTRDQVEPTRGGRGLRRGDVHDAGRDDVLVIPGADIDEPLPPGPATVLVTVVSAGLWLLITVGCVALIG